MSGAEGLSVSVGSRRGIVLLVQLRHLAVQLQQFVAVRFHGGRLQNLRELFVWGRLVVGIHG